MVVCGTCKGLGWDKFGDLCSCVLRAERERRGDKMKDNRRELFAATAQAPSPSLAGATLSRSIEAMEQELLATQATVAMLEVRISELQARNAELEMQRNNIQTTHEVFKSTVREHSRANEDMRQALNDIKAIIGKV